MQLARRGFLAGLASLAIPAWAQEDPLKGRFGGPFTLTAGDGRRISDTDLHGKFLLVYFGYTHCPDICPEDLVVMNEALVLLGDGAAKVQPLFITVDPARDTPAIMLDYVSSISSAFIGLSGSETEIAAVAKAYRVHRRIYLPAAAAKVQDTYFVDHSSLKYLMGPDGTFRTLIPHGVDAAHMAEIIQRYLIQG